MQTVVEKNTKTVSVEEKEKDRLTIQRAYRTLLQTIRHAMDEEDQKNVRLAFDMAVEAHDGQRRKSGDPYILHPIEVARICVVEIGLGPTAVICALLHDVVEDTPVTLEDIRTQFGERGKNIADIVDGLTKLDRSNSPKEKQAANFRKVLTTLTDDVRVVLIKMADRLHNMRTLGAMPQHKQLRIASETSFIYAPLAHRLGLYAIKTQFEDLSMKITDPENYHYIAKKLNETKRSREAYVEKFIAPIKKELDELPDLKGRYRIFGRPKSIYSISNKIKKKNVAFEQIYDLFAIRIIVDIPKEKITPLSSPEEQNLMRKRHDQKVKLICWSVYSVVTDIYRPIPERLKDWINRPKANGYESLHTTVVGLDGRFVEIQIRDERMDAVAERGFAAHWKYKTNTAEPDVYSIWLDSVRDVLNDPNSSPTEFLQDFKSGLFQDEVYVFTPEGDMKILPKGATALDFAFSVHTDLGYHCSSLIVNNKIVPLGYELSNGDQVEVFTNPKQKPREAWINSVITSKARSKIRSAMKEERRKTGELGKEKLERKLKHLKVDFEKSINFLVDFLGYKSHLDLYYDIAVDARSISSIFKDVMVEQGKLVSKIQEITTNPEANRPLNDTSKVKKTSKLGLFINDEPAELYKYQLASCCNPVQGDSIFAYITVSSELKIHRTNCSNAPHMMASHGHRVMKAEWATTGDHTFVADLKITGWDKGKGIIQHITKEISSSLGLNIRSFAMNGNEGVFEGEVSLLVANKDQLYLAIEALKQLDNVSTVTRVK
ncbi:MAG: HD domain-containing protein [Bacteroidota bacterium]